jgi:hypothetical protein
MRTESNAQSDRNIANFLLRDDHVIAYGLRHEYLTLWLMRMWTGVQAEPDALVPHDLCLKSKQQQYDDGERKDIEAKGVTKQRTRYPQIPSKL